MITLSVNSAHGVHNDCCYCGGCYSDRVTRDLVERSSQTLTELVHSRRLVVVASHVTYVANDISAVSVSVQCPPNWSRVAIGNDTWCGTSVSSPLSAVTQKRVKVFTICHM